MRNCLYMGVRDGRFVRLGQVYQLTEHAPPSAAASARDPEPDLLPVRSVLRKAEDGLTSVAQQHWFTV